MKRTTWLMLLLGGLAGTGGCASMEGGPGNSPGGDAAPWAGTPYTGCPGNAPPTSVPGTMLWNGAPAPMVAPYTSQPPRTPGAAQAMMSRNVPLDMVAQASYNPAALEAAGIRQVGAGGAMTPTGLPTMPPLSAGGGSLPPGVVAGVGMNVPGMTAPFRVGRTQVRFVSPSGMKINWFAPGPDGKNVSGGGDVPFRYNFNQAGIYRLKLSDIPGRAGLELYPTLEVVPTNSRTADFLAHTSVPLTFTDEDFDQVVAGNHVIKVIYLPDPQYQDLATLGGAGEIVSTRLQPGEDPIAQASSRGSILLVIRLGNVDLEAPNTPSMDAPNPFAPPPACPPGPGAPGLMGGMSGPGMGGPGGMGGMAGGRPPGPMVPYGMGGGMGGGPMIGGGMMLPGMPGMMPPGAGPAPTGSPVSIPQGPGSPPAGPMLPPATGAGTSAATK